MTMQDSKNETDNSKHDRSTLLQGRQDYIPGAGRIGVLIFIASLSMLFAASIIGYLIIRSQAEIWPPPYVPSLPNTLWISTIILLISSGTMIWAHKSIKKNQITNCFRGLLFTALLGIAFLVAQWLNWQDLIQLQILPRSKNMYAFTFYMLTGLHAVHVIGGLVILAFVTVKAYRGAYNATYHPGVEYSSIYWHFLDIVWIIMFTLLVIFN